MIMIWQVVETRNEKSESIIWSSYPTFAVIAGSGPNPLIYQNITAGMNIPDNISW